MAVVAAFHRAFLIPALSGGCAIWSRRTVFNFRYIHYNKSPTPCQGAGQDLVLQGEGCTACALGGDACDVGGVIRLVPQIAREVLVVIEASDTHVAVIVDL